MTNLKMSSDVEKRLKNHGADKKNIVLDFDDGVGPYSVIGGCALDGGFKLLLVGSEVGDDYQVQLDSPLGKIWVKDYSYEYFENENPQLKLSGAGMIQLTNNSGVVESNLEVVDDPEVSEGIR
ncbi:iron-sulfur cluster biosynthesis family protein [Secundilactobacillus malefermentans]|uniref:Core domain-containing protein n=1 Tax=Secundilactobacillus malefermentans TaxID=176292 RepID=A0A4R5NM73_9LACO|nr:iron-sulfur cluster biosynthesis family protein [Secundilactobacillus malefermentans]KRM57659.1 hypothetical protein FD44_GL001070 [Secundilactobacillus malefermentans DSM 5705 = KCTC 3548]QEA31880.1 iron-sulfur cluster biosynthesis family protein [Secundilactobacillus malefermentans]TDG76763.1 hypothetical protein C5L31_001347 [Secundilactobacillus malefermentans]